MPGDRATPLVGYVLRKFPVLSETFVLQEILALEARGIQVHVFSLARSSDPRFHEDLARLKASVSYVPDVSDVPALLKRNRYAYRRFRRRYVRTLARVAATGNTSLLWRFLQSGYVALEARRRGVTHLHAHFATRATTVALLASRISRIPYSFTAHAYDIYRDGTSVKALAEKIERARFVVAVSDFNKAYLERVVPGAAGKVVRVYNGIDLERFAPANGRPPSPFTILAVARLVEKKGLPVLVDACARLRDRGVSFRCWIVGKGGLRPQLKEAIDRLELQEHVHLLGAHTQLEVLERYRAADLYVLPCVVDSDGNRDGLPVSMVEALACGLPVVTTPVTGIPEAVRHEDNGLLVPERDPEALADAIESLVRNPRLRERLRTNARASVESRFDLRRTSEALERLFEGEH